MKKGLTLILALVLIIGAIIFLENYSSRSGGGGGQVVEVVSDSTGMDIEKKAMMFSRAKEITTPNGFINTDSITVEELVGDKIVLIDFWTYSCINCQRTTPYLNAWHDKYADDGLVIVGVHTPEFEFEKDIYNVQEAVLRFGIQYPVVLDNDFSTWRAYQNRFWPRKYLIDIDGFIVYDHIGEGGYEETERKIQELLKERNERLQLENEITSDIAEFGEEVRFTSKTQEIYFGSGRNERLGNGRAHVNGAQTFTLPDDLSDNYVYLEGEWEITDEYAQNLSEGAKIILPYESSDVFTVASSDNQFEYANSIIVKRDGSQLKEAAGSDTMLIQGDDIVDVEFNHLYKLIEDSKPGKHLLEIEVLEPGFQIYTFTFG